MVLGDLDSHMQKNETRSPTYAIHKNKLKIDKRLQYRSLNNNKKIKIKKKNSIGNVEAKELK